MIKFDREKALAGEPVVTRDGLELKQLRYYVNGGSHPWRATIEGFDRVSEWGENGKYYIAARESPFDLFMKPPEPELFIWYAVVGLQTNNPNVHESSKTKGGRAVYSYASNLKCAEAVVALLHVGCEIIEVKGKRLFNVKDIK